MSKPCLLLTVPMLVLTFLVPVAHGQVSEAQKAWEDFIHYTRIAQLQLATNKGQEVLRLNLEPEALLALVEESPYADDYQQTLDRAINLNVAAGAAEGAADDVANQAAELAAVARQVSEAIENARLALARDTDRIKENVEKLNTGRRAYQNAVRRLKEAGQYAAPQLLVALQDRSNEGRARQPFVVMAMVDIGRPLVEPLSVALPTLSPTGQQQVAQVLGRIGYPTALPYIQALIENDSVDAGTMEYLTRAYSEISRKSGLRQQLGASELFYLLAEDYYARRTTLLPDPESDTQLVWYSGDAGALAPQTVPTAIYHDVMSMRASREAIKLNSELSEGLSLWLAANFRRQNSLPGGATDPTYSGMNDPSFYAKLAGPRHLHAVLSRALNSRDAELALDAIRALSDVAGTDNLVNGAASAQPLIDAMSYADRRVRYEAAMALAASRPQTAFSGSGRVIPVLVDATRQTGQTYALVLAADQEVRNSLADAARANGYEVLIGSTVDGAAAQIQNLPGIDLVILAGDRIAIERNFSATRRVYALQSSPVVALARPMDMATLTRSYVDAPGVTVAAANAEITEILPAAIAEAAATSAGQPLDAELATTYALVALDLMRDLTLGASGEVFEISEAKNGLMLSLKDNRAQVAASAGRVLSQIKGEDVQQALATAAMATGDSELKISFLESLATNARLFGAHLTEQQYDQLIALVDSASGDVAVAAAEAYGALNLPTTRSAQSITK